LDNTPVVSSTQVIKMELPTLKVLGYQLEARRHERWANLLDRPMPVSKMKSLCCNPHKIGT
jgi:hypothetical protein